VDITGKSKEAAKLLDKVANNMAAKGATKTVETLCPPQPKGTQIDTVSRESEGPCRSVQIGRYHSLIRA
jgi:hypothetical protein